MFRSILALIGALFVFAAPLAASAQNFSDLTYNNSTSRAIGSAPAARVTVSAPYPVTGISTVSNIASPHNLKFFIYNYTTSTMIYVSGAKAFAADSSPTVKASDAFATVTLLPSNEYLIGAIADTAGRHYFTDNSGSLTQGVVTNILGNGNMTNFSSPAIFSCCACARISLGLVSAPPVYEVPTLSEWAMILLVLSLAGVGVVMVRRRQAL